jgi:hypothetical protein
MWLSHSKHGDLLRMVNSFLGYTCDRDVGANYVGPLPPGLEASQSKSPFDHAQYAIIAAVAPAAAANLCKIVRLCPVTSSNTGLTFGPRLQASAFAHAKSGTRVERGHRA